MQPASFIFFTSFYKILIATYFLNLQCALARLHRLAVFLCLLSVFTLAGSGHVNGALDPVSPDPVEPVFQGIFKRDTNGCAAWRDCANVMCSVTQKCNSGVCSCVCSDCPTDAGASNACGDGRFLAGWNCQLCPVDTFKVGYTAETSCTPCGVGKTTSGGVGSISCSLLPHFNEAGNCEPGWYLSAGSCKSCAAGFYKPTYSNDACLPCPLNSEPTGAIAQATSQMACQCFPGYYGLSGSKWDCAECPLGTFKSDYGNAANCLPCKAGTTNSKTGAISSGDCKLKQGWTSLNGTLTCARGYGYQASDCIACTSGTYKSTEGADLCVLCPNTFSGMGTLAAASFSEGCACKPGYYAISANPSSASDCVPCPLNTYKELASSSLECKPCPTGTTTNSMLGSSSVSDCVARPGWSFSDASKRVQPQCSAGYYRTRTGDCEQCPSGTFKGSDGNDACLQCPENSDPTGIEGAATANLACQCRSGYYGLVKGLESSCVACRANTYKTEVSNGFDNSCADCPEGTTTDGTTGAKFLSQCVPRPYTILDQRTGTFVCAAGYYYDENLSSCFACTVGTFKATAGNDKCRSCPENSNVTGTTEGATLASSACACSSGFYGLDTLQSLKCTECPPSTYKEQPGNGADTAVCVACPPNSAHNFTGVASELLCEVDRLALADLEASGSRLQRRATTTKSCNAGYEQVSNSCQKCKSGYYKTAAGKTTCTACPSSTVASGTTGSTSAVSACTCKAGFSGSGGTSCVACVRDTYKTAKGNTACTACPAGGSTNGATGQTSALACITPKTGWTRTTSTTTNPPKFECSPGYGYSGGNCVGCAAGFYKTSVGSVACTACPAGFSATGLQTSTALTNACQCSAGSYLSSSSCLKCPVNTYKSAANNDNACTSCPTGSNTNGIVGATAASACVASTGYVSAGDGTFVCNVGYGYTGSGCQACSSGLYKGSIGNTACSSCPPYSTASNTLTGQTTPSAVCTCSSGFYGLADAGDTSCKPCPPDTYKSNSSNGAVSVCSSCPKGSTTAGNSGVTTSSSCVALPGFQSLGNGQFVCAPGFGYTSAGACTPCAANTFKSAAGNQACTSTCVANSVSTGATGSTSASGACNCSPGYYGLSLTTDNTCTQCPSGTYKSTASNGARADVCTPCPSVSTTSTSGATSSNQCTAPPGFVKDSSGNYVCAPGYGALSTTNCTLCLPGTYKSTAAQISCSACPANSINNAANTGGAVSIDQGCLCKSGYYGINSDALPTSCQQCPADTYKIVAANGALAACSACPVGSSTFGVLGSTSQVACVAKTGWESNGSGGFWCKAGYEFVNNDCVACKSGSFKTTAGNLGCSFCPAGSETDSQSPTGATSAFTACKCSAGYSGLATVDSLSCVACPINTYASGAGRGSSAARCTSCPTGSSTRGVAGATSPSGCLPMDCYVSDGRGGFSCDVGCGFSNTSNTTCYPCAAGGYSSTARNATCTFQCPTNSGATQQTRSLSPSGACACLRGYYGLTDSLAGCTACPADTFKAADGNGGLASCTSCPSGSTTASAVGATSSSNCVASVGYVYNGQNQLVCDIGFAGTNCAPCPAGTWKSTIGNAASCTSACPSSYAVDESALGATSISQACLCKPGFYGSPPSCVSCPLNTYKDTAGNLNGCTSCPNGGGTLLYGATSIYACSSSAATTVDSSGNNVCAAGYSPVANSDGVPVCQACPVGTFKAVIGNQACTACPGGTNAIPSATGAKTEGSACYCGDGYVRSVGTNGTCIPCPGDTYKSSSPSDNACVNCPGGYGTNSTNGAKSLTSCLLKAGFVSTGSGSPATCKAGYYFSSPTECSACPINSYKSFVGSGTCSSCPQFSTGTNVLLLGASSARSVCACQAGFYGLDSDVSSICSACPFNTYKDSIGNGPVNTVCTTCPPNTLQQLTSWYSASSSDCKPSSNSSINNGVDNLCLPGYGYSGGACSLCPAGTYKDKVGNVPCSSMLPPYAVARTDVLGSRTWQSTWLASTGAYVQDGFPKLCPPLSYKDWVGNSGIDGCTPCPNPGSGNPNKYGLASASECSVNTTTGSGNQCNPGYYYLNSACVACPQGTYKKVVGPGPCNACPSNSVAISGAIGSQAAYAACQCNQGYYGLSSSIVETCTQCPTNTFKSDAGNGVASGVCYPCASYTTAATGSSVCVPNTGYQFTSTSTPSLTCSPGYGQFPSCQKCPLGSYKETAGYASCTLCNATAGLQGNSSVTSPPTLGLLTQAQACECAGGIVASVFNTATGSNLACSACPADTYYNSATKACAACPTLTSTFGAVGQQGSSSCFPVQYAVLDASSSGGYVCDLGTFRSSATRCTVCPVGTYRSSFADSYCTNCDSSTMVAISTGSSTLLRKVPADACRCVPGYGANLQLASTRFCQLCPVDSYHDSSSGGDGTCIACPTGYSTGNLTGSSSLDFCNLKNTFTYAANGSLVCAPGAGLTTAGGQCDWCVPGTYRAADSTSPFCMSASCPQFATALNSVTGADSLQALCNCQTGYYAQVNGSSYSCLPCPANFYKDTVDNVGIAGCRACPVGTYTPVGYTLPLKSSSECSPPLDSVALLNPTDSCPAGYGFDVVSGVCTKCRPGTYSLANTRAACVACPANSVVVSAVVGATSPAQACACAGGYYGLSAGSNLWSCLPCPADSFVDSDGSCKPCPVGTSTLNQVKQIGSASCVPFPGMVGPNQCSVGYRINSQQNGCEQCGYLSYSDGAPGRQSCTTASCTLANAYWDSSVPAGSAANCKCRPGSALVSLVSQCVACAKGYYSTNGTSCEKCPDGTTTASTGSLYASQCVGGAGSLNANEVYDSQGAQRLCVPGSYRNSQQTCQVCTAGYTYGLEQSVCQTCPANSVSVARSSWSLATRFEEACACNAGYAYNAVTNRCDACPSGYYKPSMGNFACTLCPASRTTTSLAATDIAQCVSSPKFRVLGASTVCNAGYGLDASSLDCTACLPGSYKPVIGNSSCTACVPFSSPNGASTGKLPSDSCVCVSGFGGIATLQACVPCSVKSYGPECSACPFGLAVTTVNTAASFLSSCSPKPNFVYVDALGGYACQPGYFLIASNETCARCPSGYYSNLQTNGCQPVACPANSAINDGVVHTGSWAASCSALPGYTAISSGNSTVFTACPVNTYKSSLGNSECLSCPQGTTTGGLVAQTSPDACAMLPGYILVSSSATDGTLYCDYGYSYRGGRCQQCPSGTFMDHLSALTEQSCTQCPASSQAVNSDTGRQSFSSACSCQPGYTSSYVSGAFSCTPCVADTYKPTFGNVACSNCPAGTSTNGVTASSSAASCIGEPGYVFNSSGIFCDIGYGYLSSSGSCSLCVNSYKDSIANAPCKQCPQNSIVVSAVGATSASSACRCRAGYYGLNAVNSTCIACPTDTYKSSEGNGDLLQCTQCGTGKESFDRSLVAQTSVDSCVAKAGFVQTDAGLVCDKSYAYDPTSRSCFRCYNGTFSSQYGSTSCSVCASVGGVPNIATYFFAGYSADGSCLCPAGTQGLGPQGGICTPCPVNTFKSTAANGASCSPCPQGTTSPIGSTDISKCNYTYALAPNGQGCASGYGWNSASSKCEICPPGSFSDGTTGFTVCKTCSSVFSGALVGANFGSKSFQEACYCPFLYYLTSTGCSPCPAGSMMKSYRPSNVGMSDTCGYCPDGSYPSATNSSLCLPKSNFAQDPVSGLFVCDAGYYSDSLTKNCLSCPAGTFKSVIGNLSTCSACPVGLTNPATNLTAAKSQGEACVCSKNSFSLDGTANTCVWCPAGYSYKSAPSNAAGIETCVVCGSGSVVYPANAYYSSANYNVSCVVSDNSMVPDPNAVRRWADPWVCNTGYEPINGRCQACNNSYYKSTIGNSSCLYSSCKAGSNTSAVSSTTSTTGYDCVCSPGYSFVSGKCLACSGETFKSATGNSSCVACPLGTTTNATSAAVGCWPLPGAVSCFGSNYCCPAGTEMVVPSGCRPCLAGTFKPEYTTLQGGQSMCTPCPTGSVASTVVGAQDQASACTCAAGRYMDESNQCQPCPVDSFKPVGGGSACSSCPDLTSTFGVIGATSAAACLSINNTEIDLTSGGRVCSAGYEPAVSTLVRCVPCSTGYKRNAGNFACTPCPATTQAKPGAFRDGLTLFGSCDCIPGNYGLVKSINMTFCMACPTGTFSNGTFGTNQAISACLSCPKFTTTSGPGSAYAQDCSVALAGAVILPNGTATCDAGYYSSVDQSSCLPCPQGTFKSSAGFYGTCEPCPDNSSPSNTVAGAFPQAACLCNSGYFGLTFGNAYCWPCPATSFKNVVYNGFSSDTCTPCPYNTSAVQPAATSMSQCVATLAYTLLSNGSRVCSPGFELISGFGCNPCPSGTFKSLASNTSCTACPNNSRGGGSSGATSLLAGCVCSPGYFGLTSSQTTCTSCPVNQYNDVSGAKTSSQCKQCPFGTSTLGATAASSLAQCIVSAGFTRVGFDNVTCAQGYGGANCVACAPGTFKSTNDFSACSSCPDNAISDFSSASGSLYAYQTCRCKAGYSGLGSAFDTSCVPCQNGLYKNAPGNGDCTPCPWGSTTAAAYTGVMDLSSCRAKPNYVDVSGNYTFVCAPGFGLYSAQCSPCVSGTYKASAGNSPCTDTCAPDGVANGVTGATSKRQACACALGSDRTGTNPNLCTPCAINKAQLSLDGNCTACLPGTSTLGLTGAYGISGCVPNLGKAYYSSSTGTLVACAAGYFLSNAATFTCSPCPAGTFKATASNDTACNACSPFSTLAAGSPTASTSNANACSCKAGYYGNVDVDYGPVCAPCPSNSFKSTVGNGRVEDVCLQCADGFGSFSGSVACVSSSNRTSDSRYSCGLGYTYSSASQSCVRCPAGTYRDNLDYYQCLTCPSASFPYSSLTGAVYANDTCQCANGYYGLFQIAPAAPACAACPANTFKSTPGNGGVGTCQYCAEGTSTNGLTGAGSFQSCAVTPGYGYNQDPESNRTVVCARGYGQSLTSAGALNCTICPKGQYQNLLFDGASCQSCPFGSSITDMTKGPGATDPSVVCACKPGYYGMVGSVSSPTCKKNCYPTCLACPADTYQPFNISQDISGCIRCPSGKGTNGLTGQTSKNACVLKPNFINWFETYLCDYGYGYSAANDSCTLCPADSYGDDQTRRPCQPCPLRSSTLGITGSRSLSACVCEVGTFRPIYGTDCLVCPGDSYMDIRGVSLSCKACPKFSSTAGAVGSKSLSSCACLPGYYVSSQLSNGCSACPLNTFKTGYLNAFNCTNCPKGTMTLQTAISSPAGCVAMPNYVLDPASNTLVCKAGYEPVGTQCTACQANFYKASLGDRACTACGVGYHTSGATGSLTCIAASSSTGADSQTTSSTTNGSSTAAIAGGVAGGFAVLAACFAAFAYYRVRQKAQNKAATNTEMYTNEHSPTNAQNKKGVHFYDNAEIMSPTLDGLESSTLSMQRTLTLGSSNLLSSQGALGKSQDSLSSFASRPTNLSASRQLPSSTSINSLASVGSVVIAPSGSNASRAHQASLAVAAASPFADNRKTMASKLALSNLRHSSSNLEIDSEERLHETIVAYPGYLEVDGQLAYVKGEPVAQGGFSRIYKGFGNAPLISEPGEIAIKVYKSEELSKSSAQEKEAEFENEASLLCAVQECPTIVRLLAVTKAPEFSIVMPLYLSTFGQFIQKRHSSNSLFSQMCKEKPVSILGVNALFLLDLAHAVAYLHQRGIAHLDLKPTNLLIGRLDSGSKRLVNYRAVLSDFGLARLVKEVNVIRGRKLALANGLSIKYSAPEAFDMVRRIERGEPVSWQTYFSCDIYSLSMSVYEGATCRIPFQNMTAAKVEEQVKDGKRPELSPPQAEKRSTEKELQVYSSLKRAVLMGWVQNPNSRCSVQILISLLSRAYELNLES